LQARPAHVSLVAILDTGILVRATTRSNGPARRLVDGLAANPAHVALSPYILGEVGKALSYPHVPQIGIPVILSDPDDDPILSTGYGLDVMDDVALLSRLLI
jgi:predicted nucleic acid-binding protein